MNRDADELILFTDNDYRMRVTQRQAFLDNMTKKMVKGTYDPKLGVKLWTYYADRAAQAYAKEAGNAKGWHQMFSTATRREVAAHYEKEARRELAGKVRPLKAAKAKKAPKRKRWPADGPQPSFGQTMNRANKSAAGLKQRSTRTYRHPWDYKEGS